MKKLIVSLLLVASTVMHGDQLLLNSETIKSKQEAIAVEIARIKQIRNGLKLAALTAGVVFGYKVWSTGNSVGAGSEVQALTNAQLTDMVKAQGAQLAAQAARITTLEGGAPVWFTKQWFVNNAKNLVGYASFGFVSGEFLATAQRYYNKLFYSPNVGWYITSCTQLGAIAEQIKFSLDKIAQPTNDRDYHIQSFSFFHAQFIQELEGVLAFIGYEVDGMQKANLACATRAAVLHEHMIARTNRFLTEIHDAMQHVAMGQFNGHIVFEKYMQELQLMVGRFMLYEK